MRQELKLTEEQRKVELMRQYIDLGSYIDSGYNVDSLIKENYVDVARYYQRNIDSIDQDVNPDFLIPRKRRVQYILIDKDQFSLRETISEKDIARHYEENKYKFLDDDLEPRLLEDVRAEIEDELKEKYVVTDEEIEKYYEENITVYQNSDDDTAATLAKMRGYILKELQQRKKRVLAKELADKIFVIFGPERMRWLADRYDLPMRYSELFSLDEKVDDYIGDSQQFKLAAFQTEIGTLSDIIETERGFALLSPIEELPLETTPAPLSVIYDTALENYHIDQASDVINDIVYNRWSRVTNWMRQSKTSFDTACIELGIPFEESDWFSRLNERVEGIGSVDALTFRSGSKTITPFEMKAGELKLAQNVPGGALFCMVSETKFPTDEEFEEEKEFYTTEMIKFRSRGVVMEWLTQLWNTGVRRRATR